MTAFFKRVRSSEQVPIVLSVFVLVLTLLGPLLGRAYGKYLIVFYLAYVPWVLTHPIPKPRRVPFLYLYLAVNALALVVHLRDLDSVLNAGSLLVSVVAIAGAAYYCVRGSGSRGLDGSLERWLWISLGLAFVFSIILTGLGWPTAPDYFPWEAFYSQKRFLLINGDRVGHTTSLWVMAFLSAFTVHRLSTERKHKIGLVVLLYALVLCLLATKSRLALIYIINLVVMWLAYRNVPFLRGLVFAVPGAYAVLFVLVAVSVQLGIGINLAAHTVQDHVGEWVRVTPAEEFRATVFAGRDILNQALLPASWEKPLQGLGDDADILSYGVDADGYIAYNEDRKKANTESVLRLAVKYGWPYFGVLVMFLASIPWALRRLKKREQILKVVLWGMCVESIASGGGMEVFYGTSGLFLFVLCLVLFEATLDKRWRALGRPRVRMSTDCGGIS
jgi:hypothetical protein